MKKIIILGALLIGFLFSPVLVLAQEVIVNEDVSLSAAIPVKVTGTVVDGDIISLTTGGNYTRSTVVSDPLMFGVIAMSPALYLYDRAAKDELPAVNSGKTFVRVSTEMGNIKKGDLITSSTKPGVGVKALSNGYVLGTAQEDYEAKPDQIGKIMVAINPRFVQTNSNILSTLFQLPTLSLSATPMNALRYIIAALIIITSFYIGFRFFGRASLKGVEAIGRNPLAKKSIILVVVVNASLTFGIMLIGFAIAYVVVVF